MRKKRKIIFSLLLILTITTLFISCEILSSKELKTIVSSFINLKSYATANEITSLDTPIGLKWLEEGTATIKWDSVESANYYQVNIYLYDFENTLLGTKETGTSINELDIQQEINYLLLENNISKFYISFKVTAMYIYDDITVMSNISEESLKKLFEVGTGVTKLKTPMNVNISEDYIATWSADEQSAHYVMEFYMDGYSDFVAIECVFKQPSSIYSWGTINGDVFQADITKAIESAYKFMIKKNQIQSGETVELKVRVKAETEINNSEYIESDYSSYSNTFSYSDSTSKKLKTPMNVNVSDDYIATWSADEESDYYEIEFYTNGDSYVVGEGRVDKEPSSNSWGTINGDVFQADITKEIDNIYRQMIYRNEIQIGDTVEFKIKAKAKTEFSNQNEYIESDYSSYSNTFSYSNSTLRRLKTPMNINVSDDYIATWSADEESDYYEIEFYMNGYSYVVGAERVYKEPSDYSWGTINGDTFQADITKAIDSAYKLMIETNKIKSGETVELKIIVKAKREFNNTENYLDSDYSSYSNNFYYNSDGSTKIESLILSPGSPVIAVGRSIYMGKTILPANALYSSILWKSSDDDVVSITDMGQITGIKPGTATVTAKVNNAIQTAEVNVYEIKSNIKDNDDCQSIIDKANDIIEAVVSNGDLSNTDIINKVLALKEILTGAQNGDLFNVNMMFYQYTQEKINELLNEIKSKYSGYSIVGANDINIEISHEDSDGESHHIANITELEEKIGVTIDLSNSIPELPSNKRREYKLIRKHNGVFENINFSIDNGIVKTDSDKFSEFVLLYKDIDVPVTGISVNKESMTTTVGETVTVIVSVLPENAANKNYIVKSSNESVVAVENNVITAVAPGTATITFTSEDGGYSKTVTVTVNAPLKSISLNKTTGTQNLGGAEELTVTYNPANTTDDKTVTWTSSNESVATVDSKGKVTAKALGQAIITATVGGKTASYTVNVVYAYSKGDGTKNNPYIIKSSLDLYYMKENLSAYYALGNDIDLTHDTHNEDGLFYNDSNGWKPISNSEVFTGSFDGKGYKIKGIYQRIINNDFNSSASTGLFGNIKGNIKNLVIEDFKLYYENVSSTYHPHVGVLGSYATDSIIENVSASGEIEMFYGNAHYKYLNVGGMLGRIEKSTLKNITNKVNLNLGLKYLFASGGISSEIENSTLNNISNYGTIEGYSAGGIACYLIDSNITNVKNYGTIKATQGGGISFQFSGSKMLYGSNYGTLDMKTNGTGGFVGGLVGHLSASTNSENSQEAIIDQSFNAGLINAVLTNKDGDIGGIAGTAYGNQYDGTKPVSIKNSYNIGELNIKNPTVYSCIGGLVGRFSAHIENSYNVGNIKLYNSVDAWHVNELVGAITRMDSDNSAGSLDKVYYVEKGINAYSNDGGGILLNTKSLSFNNAINKNSYTGFDFNNIWAINNNYPFPQLKSNLLEGEYINSIIITNEDTNLISQQDYQLTYSVSPNKFTKNDLIFEIIEGNDLASIDSNGKMSLNGKGKIKVRVSSKKINSIYSIKEFNLLIIKDMSELNILDINDMIYDGKEKKPEIEIYDGDYKLTSDDYEVAYTNNIKPGIATITIKGKLNYKGVIEKKFNIVNPLKSISLNKTSGIKKVGETETLAVTYNPIDTTDDKTVVWTTSNAKIATVDTNGKVKAIAPGQATITAKVGDKTATYVIDVKSPLVSISLNKTTGQLDVSQEQDLVVTYNPIDTTDDKTVVWTTSNAKIATVDTNGKVKAIAPGQTTITATVGDKTATYVVDVKSPLVSISLNKTSGTLRVGGIETLTVTYNPNNTTDNKKVTWSSNDTSVAKVENGKITALKAGEATITATVGDKTATYKLTVIEKETLQERFIKKGFKIKNNFVHGFKLEDLLTNIKNIVELDYTVTGGNTVISTGIQFKYNSEIFTAVVYGDLNGDGKINSADLLKMRQHLLGTSVLSGAYKEAGSIATGTTINSADLLRIRQHLLGQKLIEQ